MRDGGRPTTMISSGLFPKPWGKQKGVVTSSRRFFMLYRTFHVVMTDGSRPTSIPGSVSPKAFVKKDCLSRRFFVQYRTFHVVMRDGSRPTLIPYSFVSQNMGQNGLLRW